MPSPLGYSLLRPDFPPKRHAFGDGQVEDATILPAHDHRPGQQLGRLLCARCERIKKSRQDFRLNRLQMPERITIFRFQAAIERHAPKYRSWSARSMRRICGRL